MTVDPYLDPGSGVLRNRLGITDPRQLRQVEADLTLAALQDLGTRVIPGSYDLAHLLAFHREIFADIYPWAGQLSYDAGWPINWSRLDRDENEHASIAAVRGDNQPLRTLLDELVTR